jgi:hypothetical protein
MQQQPPHGANLDGPNLVTKTTNSTRKGPEKPRAYESLLTVETCNNLRFASVQTYIFFTTG